MKKRGRPAGLNYSEQMLVKLTKEEKNILKEYSVKLKEDKSTIVRNAIAEYIARHSGNSFTLPMFNK